MFIMYEHLFSDYILIGFHNDRWGPCIKIQAVSSALLPLPFSPSFFSVSFVSFPNRDMSVQRKQFKPRIDRSRVVSGSRYHPSLNSAICASRSAQSSVRAPLRFSRVLLARVELFTAFAFRIFLLRIFFWVGFHLLPSFLPSGWFKVTDVFHNASDTLL